MELAFIDLGTCGGFGASGHGFDHLSHGVEGISGLFLLVLEAVEESVEVIEGGVDLVGSFHLFLFLLLFHRGQIR